MFKNPVLFKSSIVPQHKKNIKVQKTQCQKKDAGREKFWIAVTSLSMITETDGNAIKNSS